MKEIERIKLTDYLCRQFNIEVGDITRTRFMGKVAETLEQYVIKAREETIDKCVEVVENGVLIDISFWNRTKKELSTEIHKELCRNIVNLKQGLTQPQKGRE